MTKPLDITNQRFGRLVAVEPTGRDTHKNVLWLCQCDCGKTAVAAVAHLRYGKIQSCKCSHFGSTNPNYRHGHTRTGKYHPLYRAWSTMRDRCNNPNNPKYKYYGAQGVKIDPRWDDFRNFLSDVGERPHPNLTLDRYPDRNGDYTPNNVRWATPKEQANNKRPYAKRKNNSTSSCRE